MWRHVSPKVHQHLLPYATFEIRRCGMDNDKTTDGSGTSGNVFCTRNDFYVNAQFFPFIHGKRHHGGVGNEGQAMLVCQGRKHADVGYLELWVGHGLHKDAACGVVDGGFHSNRVCKVAETGDDPEPCHRILHE